MRTANPFDGRAFVRSRNDVNPKRRREGGDPKPPRDFCKLPIIDRGSEADCPLAKWKCPSSPVVSTFFFFYPALENSVFGFHYDCSKEEGSRKGKGLGDQYFFQGFRVRVVEPWGRKEKKVE